MSLVSSHKRWKSVVAQLTARDTTARDSGDEMLDRDGEQHGQAGEDIIYESGNLQEGDYVRQPMFPNLVTPRAGPQFRITGNSLFAGTNAHYMLNQGRPIPTVQVVENPVRLVFKLYMSSKRLVILIHFKFISYL